MASTAHLFSPLKQRDLLLPNRIVVAPMSQYSAVNGNATDWHLQHIGHLAISGAGLFMIEASAVAPEGRATHQCLGLYSDENEAALRRGLDSCRSYSDMRFGIQLAHSGRKGSGRRPWEARTPLGEDESPWATFAPSPVPLSEGWPVPIELDTSGLQRVIDQFVAATHRADRLGIDLVEIHSAHGYLLHQFLSPLSNRRADRFGGSLENRMRFPLAVVAAVREAWPSAKPMSVRLSATDWLDGGFDLDEAVIYSRELASIGCDCVCVSSGGLDSKAKVPTGAGYQVPFAARIRREAKVATRAAGLLVTPQQADHIISGGEADQVVLARTMLHDPRWVWHAAQSLNAPIAYPLPYERAHPSRWPGAASKRMIV